MLKANLANELRQRQYKLGKVSRELVDFLTDDQIIDSYITCSCCGEKQVDTNQLPRIIEDAEDIDQFFAACDAIAKSKSNVNNCIEGILKEKGF
jgi:hypothetical protein